MTSFLHLVVDNYNEVMDSKKDPLVDSWLLMRSPMPIIMLLVIYLYFVLNLGPKLMKNRPAYGLKAVMICYNAFQVLFSFWLSGKFCSAGIAILCLLFSWCTPTPDEQIKNAISVVNWWYFFSKIIDLLDTVFFVLRKKQNQVSFLHIYHHSIIIILSWANLKFLSGEQCIFIGFLNSCVHVIMYAYYFLAALGPKYQKYLWWKKYMTEIQMGQFCIMLVYLLALIIVDGKLPNPLTFLFASNTIIFLYLFTDFYRTAYKKPKKVDDITNGSVKEEVKLQTDGTVKEVKLH